MTRPVLELIGFRRVALAAGESATVTFSVPVAQLGFHDHRGVFVVEPGTIDVFVGRSAVDLVNIGSFEVVTGDGDAPLRRSMDGTVRVELMEGATRS